MALTQISTAGVKDDAVTSGKIPANAVGSSELADNAVDTAAIADDAVTAAKLASDAVVTTSMVDDAVTAAKLAADAVVTASMVDDAVTAAKLAADAVVTASMVDDAVTAAKLASDAVVTASMVDDAVTLAKLADNSVTTANIVAEAVNTGQITDAAVTSQKIADGTIVNADISTSAAINGTKIAPNFGSQNIETTGNVTCDGEFQPHWIGHQSQCTENTFNTSVYWKVAEITGAGCEGGEIVFYGTDDYSGLGHNGQASRTTLVIRCLTNNQLGGVYWTQGGSGNSSVQDIRWKYTGANNIYEIWIKKGGYNNVVPHITGSFDYAKTFGSTTGSGTAPSGSTAFETKFVVGNGTGTDLMSMTDVSGGIIFQGKRVFSASGYTAMNNGYSFDIPCANDSGNGQFFYVIAGHTHYNHSYAAIRISHFCARGTSIVDTQNYTNLTSGYGGSWSVSKPNNTTFRLTHNAGSYSYSGYYHVTVMTST